MDSRLSAVAAAPSDLPAHDTIDVDRMPHALELDGFRALAIVLVLMAHLGLYWVVPGGFGVTVFFFLSGFLITSLMRVELRNSGTLDLKGFYTRRFLRIVPPLAITMAFSVILVATGLVNTAWSPVGVLGDMLFMTNYVKVYTGQFGFPGMPLWSLAVEEHFYLLFPLVVLALLPKLGAKRLALLCAGACLAVLLARFAHAATGGLEGNYYLTHTRIDSILVGCILALWQNPVLGPAPVWKPRLWHLGAALGALLLMFAIRSEEMRQTIRYSIQGAALIVVFSWTLQSGNPVIGKIARLRIVQLTARYSYAMYLVHALFVAAVEKMLPDVSLWLRAPLVLALTYGYCALMYIWVERPLAAIRQRMNRKNEAANPAA